MRPTTDRPSSDLSIVLPDGDRIAARVDGGGPAMLIYNGLVSTPLHFRAWIPYFSRRFGVVSWDYRGHGRSPRPSDLDRVSIAAFAEDGHQVLGACAPGEKAILCGLSMGVQAALEHVRRHPEDVRALVLLCGTPGHPLNRVSSSASLRRAAASLLRLAGRAGWLLRLALGPLLGSPLVREIAYLTGGAHREHLAPGFLDELFEGVARMDPDVLTRAVASYLEHSAWDVLERIEVPTLVIAGGSDQLTPASVAEEAVRRVRGAELHVVEGHTHLAQLERTDEVHSVVERFFEKHGL